MNIRFSCKQQNITQGNVYLLEHKITVHVFWILSGIKC